MKRLSLLSLLLLAACANNPQGGAVVGGAVGGATGAAVGYEMGGRDGAIIGGAIGGAAGAVIGSDASQPAQPASRTVVVPAKREVHQEREHDDEKDRRKKHRDDKHDHEED
jgi:outer membrane lipoprotein SlyB